MWSVVNHFINSAFEIFLRPISHLPVIWQVCALALPAALLALLIYRYTSDQVHIETTKNRIKAHLLELLLFKDDLKVMLWAQGRILRYTLTYMRLALVPMAVMILPFVIFLIQVESRYALRSLEPEEVAILSATLNDNSAGGDALVSLSIPEGIVRETPALRIDETREIFWRIRAVTAGEYRIGVTMGKQRLEKRVVVGQPGRSVSPAVYRENDIRTLLYPAEPALPSAAFAETIRLDYPQSGGSFAGLSSASWIFFGMTLLFGLLLRGLFGVTF